VQIRDAQPFRYCRSHYVYFYESRPPVSSRCYFCCTGFVLFPNTKPTTCFQSLFLSTKYSHTVVERVLFCDHRLPLSCSIHCLGFLERHNTSIFLVLIFIPARLHAAENRSSACWRPCWEDANSTKSSWKSQRLILQQHPTVTPSSTRPCLSVLVVPNLFRLTAPYREI